MPWNRGYDVCLRGCPYPEGCYGQHGADASPDIKAEMASGESLIEGSGAQSPVKIAQSAVNIMYTYLNGDKVESRYPVETFLITSENVDKYGTDGWQ